MKILSILFLLITFQSVAQTKPVKIVFDVTSADTLTHQAVLRHVSLMAAAYPQSSFEVVVYGNAMPMYVKGKSTVTKAIQKLEANPNVTFKVCEQTMARYKVDKSQLVANVGTVPDGILEIVNKQAEGWGYIKEAHH
jgi:intracellular sulfur oxidation DsrE/DsrF family protein